MTECRNGLQQDWGTIQKLVSELQWLIQGVARSGRNMILIVQCWMLTLLVVGGTIVVLAAIISRGPEAVNTKTCWCSSSIYASSTARDIINCRVQTAVVLVYNILVVVIVTAPPVLLLAVVRCIINGRRCTAAHTHCCMCCCVCR